MQDHSKFIKSTLIASLIISFSSMSCETKPSNLEPEIWIIASQLQFSTFVSGPNPSSQTLQILNSGAGTLDYAITDDMAWLSCSPTYGSSTGNINEHTISVDVVGLMDGVYTGKIIITSSNASNSPEQVNVTLEIFQPDSILISCVPNSGGTGTIINIPVTINGNKSDIKAFGLDLAFSKTIFEYQGVDKGDLTGNWSTVAGNEVSSGALRIGGYAGGASPVSKWSSGSIVKITLKVIYSGTGEIQSQISIQNYVDDLAIMTPMPSYATFIYKK